MNQNLKIEYIPIEDIKPYENNAKQHPAEQIQQIKNSILEFGFNDPLALWHDTIVEGHGRLLAAQELGYKELPIIRLDDLSDEQRKAYTLAHNKLTMNSDFDLDVLSAELDSILDIDMSDFGFDLGEDFSPDDFGEDFSLPDGDKPEIGVMTFTLHEKQKELIQYAMSLVTDDAKETFGNTNKNGNALYEVVRQWAEQRK
ncbi:MAG: ParB N-terminal domain-containing protein [Bacteroidaceae bacterium]|nr:ParB N-terminal domain-containing protein [Bacteroidaceae bacterium]